MSQIYIIADTHFNHKNIIKYCNRPHNFEELIWENLKKIPKDALLFHLGDFCLGKNIETHQRLSTYPFRKRLILGNHDEKLATWYIDHGWDAIQDQHNGIIVNGKYITLSHYPLLYDGSFDINIHGHFHNNSRENWEPELEKLVTKDHHRLFILENENYQAVELSEFLSCHP